MTLDKLKSRLLISMALGVVVFVGLSAYADFSAILESAGSFKWQYLPLVLGLTSLNYALRFCKWQFYLRTIGVRDFDARDSALVYYSGLGMAITPGKVGEWLKSFLLRELHGTPVSRSAPVVIAERLTDSLGLVVLGAAGLVVFGDAWPAFVAIVLGGAMMFVLVRHRPFAHWVLDHLEGVPVASRFARHAEDFYVSTYALLSPFALGSMTLLSVLSWGFEVIGFYFVLMGLGVDSSWDVLLKASFIMPAATLASALLLTPGGLVVAEGGITGLSVVLLDLPRASAALGTLIIRFSTLWFGVIVGMIALFFISRTLARRKGEGLEEILEEASEDTETSPPRSPSPSTERGGPGR